MRLHPFRALRPAAGLVEKVAAPPYDVVTRDEATALAAGNPLSFLHVSRSDIDLPADTDPRDARVYARARQSLERLVAEDVLVREPAPALYVYREVMEGREQTGIVGGVHVDDYAADVIKKHERTQPEKEEDRTRHIIGLGAHAEAVLFAYRRAREVDALVSAATAAAPLFDFMTADGVRHTLWPVPDPSAVVDAFGRVPAAYVADGHHRSASAWRAAQESTSAGRPSPAEILWFPAALVPADELAIRPYNRVVRDLGGRHIDAVLADLAALGRVAPTSDPAPPRAGTFCFYADRRWYRLELAPGSIDRGDPVRSLDVWLLQERVLEPVLGIGDQRTDRRIEFVGGGRGVKELERRVDTGQAMLAISMFPTAMEHVMAVADAGAIMPPKSTWFEPKLLSGLFVHTVD